MVSLQATVALVTIGLYLLVILAVGYLGWQVGKLEVEDWMAASRDLGLVVLLFTYAATYHSAFAFLGISGFVYGNGIGIFGAAFLWVALSGLILWVLGTRVWLLFWPSVPSQPSRTWPALTTQSQWCCSSSPQCGSRRSSWPAPSPQP